MKIISIFSLLIAPLLFLPEKQLSEDEESAFLKRLEMNQQALSTLSADFSQVNSNPIFTEPIESKGLFCYAKPDKIRWEETLPNAQYIIINGKKFIQYDGKKVIKSSANSMQASIFKRFMLKTINGTIFKDKSFSSNLVKEGDFVRIELVPTDKRMKNRISRIAMTFHNKILVLKKLALYENEQVNTVITFTNQVKDKSISDNLFEADE